MNVLMQVNTPINALKYITYLVGAPLPGLERAALPQLPLESGQAGVDVRELPGGGAAVPLAAVLLVLLLQLSLHYVELVLQDQEGD